MRIGVDCRSLEEPQPSGVSLYSVELLKSILALPAAGKHEFVLYLNHSADAQRLTAAVSSWQRAGQVTVRQSPLPKKLFTASTVLFSQPRVQQLFGPVDRVFVPNMQFYPLADRSVPYVLTMHDLSYERYPECLTLKGRLRHRLLRPRRFVSGAQHLIAVSEHTKSDLIQLYGVAAETVTVIPPGLVPPPPATPAEGTIEPVPGGRYIFSLATLEPRKNLATLLAAMQIARQNPALADLRLVVAGGTGWKSRALRRQIAATDGVEYLGYIDSATKYRYMRHATAFVYPSLYEGFGFPPLEALACGVPALVGNHSSLPEVLGNGALYVDVKDSQAMARGLSHIVLDQSLRSHLVEEGHRQVRVYSWSTAAAQTLQLLEQAVPQPQ